MPLWLFSCRRVPPARSCLTTRLLIIRTQTRRCARTCFYRLRCRPAIFSERPGLVESDTTRTTRPVRDYKSSLTSLIVRDGNRRAAAGEFTTSRNFTSFRRTRSPAGNVLSRLRSSVDGTSTVSFYSEISFKILTRHVRFFFLHRTDIGLIPHTRQRPHEL